MAAQGGDLHPLLELIPQWLGTSASENSPLAGTELPTLCVEAVSILHDIVFAKKLDVEFGSAEGMKRNRYRGRSTTACCAGACRCRCWDRTP